MPKHVGFVDGHNSYSATQLEGESYKQWAARLRGLTAHCNFANTEESLRDQFIMGVEAGTRTFTDAEVNMDLPINMGPANTESTNSRTEYRRSGMFARLCRRSQLKQNTRF